MRETRSFFTNFRMLGFPSASEWPEESPIGREAFESYRQSTISLERLLRFEDNCAYELLRVILSINLES